MNIHIVLIGTYNKSPSIIDVEKVEKICQSNNFKLKIYLIDVNFLNKKISYPESITHYYVDDDDFEDTMTISVFPDPYENLFHTEQERVVASNAKFLDHLKSTTDPVWYYSDLHKNGYDLSRSVHTKTFNKKYFNCIQPYDLVKVVNNIIASKEPELYNPLSGSKIEHKLNPNDTEELKRTLYLGFYHLYWFLRSGFHLEKKFLNPDDPAPGWVFQMSSKWLSLLVDIYDVRPHCPDLSVQMQMNESSDFRKMITEGTLAVLSNYIINNNLSTLQNIKDNGGWYNPQIWETLREIIFSK